MLDNRQPIIITVISSILRFQRYKAVQVKTYTLRDGKDCIDSEWGCLDREQWINSVKTGGRFAAFVVSYESCCFILIRL